MSIQMLLLQLISKTNKIEDKILPGWDNKIHTFLHEGATLTISLMLQNRLWGLIACDHYSPKHIDSNTRIAAQLQGHFITSQITGRQISEEYAVALKVNKCLDDLLAQIFSADSITFNKIIQQQE